MQGTHTALTFSRLRFLSSSTRWLSEYRQWGIQVLELTRVRLSARYRGTWAGVLWVVISPISLFLLQAAIFGQLLKGTGEDYTPYLLSGLFPWFFIVQSIEMGSGLIVSNGSLLKSLQLRPSVFIAALILDNFIVFIGSMWGMLVIYLAAWHQLRITAFLVIVPTLLLSLWTFSITWIVSLLNVFFRDTRFVVSFGLQCLFFLTPILYKDTVPIPFLKRISVYNPLRLMIVPFRDCVLSPSCSQILSDSLKAAAVTLITAAIAVQFWRSSRNAVYFRI